MDCKAGTAGKEEKQGNNWVLIRNVSLFYLLLFDRKNTVHKISLGFLVVDTFFSVLLFDIWSEFEHNSYSYGVNISSYFFPPELWITKFYQATVWECVVELRFSRKLSLVEVSVILFIVCVCLCLCVYVVTGFNPVMDESVFNHINSDTGFLFYYMPSSIDYL